LRDWRDLLELSDLLRISSLEKRTAKEQLIRNAHSYNHQAGAGDGTHGNEFPFS
jgi:hypothetical protein